MKSPADTDDTRTQGLELTTARVAASVLAPALYLIPVPLSDGPVEDVLPARNIEIVKSIRYFIVEMYGRHVAFSSAVVAILTLILLNLSN